MTVYLTKLAVEDKDWTFDWTPKGVSSLDPIESFTLGDSIPEGLTIHSTSYSQTATTAWFSSGTPDALYTVLLSVTTEGGRTYAENVQMYIDAG